MWKRARRADTLEELLRWRRNLFVQACRDDATHALLCMTDQMLSVQYGRWERGHFCPTRAERYPADTALFDGHGWNLERVNAFLEANSPPGARVGNRRSADMEATETESFVGLYVGPLRKIIAQLSDSELRLYVLLSTYVDNLATCFPGLAELSRQTGWRQEDVMKVLEYLESRGLVWVLRRNALDPFTRRQLPNVYQLEGVYIRPELRPMAWDLRSQDESYRGTTPKSPLQAESEPPTLTNSKTTVSQSLPRTTTTTHEPPSKAEMVAGTPSPDSTEPHMYDSEDGVDIEPSQPTTVHQPLKSHERTESTTTKDSGVSAARRELTPAECQEPLENPSEERAADLLKITRGITIVKARQLIGTYGAELVHLGLVQIDNEIKSGASVRNPIGLLVHRLKSGYIVPGDTPPTQADLNRIRYAGYNS